MDLITLEEYKTAKGLRKDDQDDIISTLITNSSSLIQKYIDKTFYATEQTVEEIIDLDYDTDVIYLDNYPVNEIVAITELDPYYYDSTVHFPVPETIYRLDSKDGKLVRTGGRYWPRGYGAISVVYTIGSAQGATTIPPELKQATIDLVTYYLQEEWKDSKSLRGATINNNTGTGGYSNTANTNFPPHIQRVLDLYT